MMELKWKFNYTTNSLTVIGAKKLRVRNEPCLEKKDRCREVNVEVLVKKKLGYNVSGMASEKPDKSLQFYF